MTVWFNKDRGRWMYGFVLRKTRHSGYCLDALGEPVKSKSAARQAEGVARRLAQMAPKVAEAGQMTLGMAMADLTPMWRAQARWHASRIYSSTMCAAFITHAAMTSGQLAAQALARHSDYDTTRAYVEVADELRRTAADRAAQRPALKAVR